MGEIQIGAGDSVSRLLQVFAKEIGLRRQWTGNGRADLKALVVELYNSNIMRDQLWNGIRDLYAMPELKELPERVQAQLMGIILARRSIAELDTKTGLESQQNQQQHVPPGVA